MGHLNARKFQDGDPILRTNITSTADQPFVPRHLCHTDP